jgi:hypothetical protein
LVGRFPVNNELVSLAESTGMYLGAATLRCHDAVTTFRCRPWTERAAANQSELSTVAYPCGVNPSPPVKNTSRNLPIWISSPLVSTAEPIGSPLT